MIWMREAQPTGDAGEVDDGGQRRRDQEQDLDTNQMEGQAARGYLSETVINTTKRRKADEDGVWSWWKVTFRISMHDIFLSQHAAHGY